LVWTTTSWTLTANMVNMRAYFLLWTRVLMGGAQGIAVHPEMKYLAVRRVDNSGDGVFIVAADRLSALSHVLGDAETVGEIQGMSERFLFITLSCSRYWLRRVRLGWYSVCADILCDCSKPVFAHYSV